MSELTPLVFIMNQEIERQDLFISVGVMKDYCLKLRNLHVSDTLTSTDDFVYYESKKRELKRRLVHEGLCLEEFIINRESES